MLVIKHYERIQIIDAVKKLISIFFILLYSDKKPGDTSTTSSDTTTTPSASRPGPKPGSTRGSRGSYGPRGGGARQQIMPRLSLLDDEDDGVTCRMCLQPFWYKSQLHDHLKSTHSISEPER